MNVLLINPWLTMDEKFRSYPIEPLGILYIASYSINQIKKKAYNIKINIIDAQLEGPSTTIKVERGFRSGMDNNSFIDLLKSYNPDIVGITSNFTPHTNDVLEISGIIKNIYPKTMVTLGGVNATLLHTELISNPSIDLIVRNEGEETFWEILHCIYEDKYSYNILGTSTKNNKGKIIINSDRELIDNLDEIPMPDRSLVNYKKYTSYEKLYFTPKNMPVGTIISSRGCVFDCIFCSTKAMWRQKWRGRSPENVVDEIEALVKKYGIKEIAFQDDQFLFDNQRIINICREIRKRNLKISFIVPSGITPSLLKKETIKEMAASGFYRIALSIDSGTEKSKQIVNKPLNLKNMRTLVKYLNRKGLWTYATFVIGFPDETKQDIQAAIKFAYSLRVDFLRFYIAQPYPGSQLFKIFQSNGYLKNNSSKRMWDYFSIYNSFYGTIFVTKKELIELRDFAENSFLRFKVKYFFNLRYLFLEFIPKINSWNKFIYFLRLLSQLRHLDKSRGFTFKEGKPW